MNIFYLDADPKICAEAHADKHCVKMVLEYAQLLCTAHRVLDGIPVDAVSKTGRKQVKYILNSKIDRLLYSATHVNHPSAVWARESRSNYLWLCSLWECLMKEYTYRYEKNHACEKLISALRFSPGNIADVPFVEPTPAMPDVYKVANDSIQSYHNYYIGDKARMFSWKNRVAPAFVIDSGVFCQ